MQESICFVSGRKISLEARLFTGALCRFSAGQSLKLITRCASAAEMIAFKEWKTLKQPIDLVIPIDQSRKLSRNQEKIVSSVHETGGSVTRPFRSKDLKHQDPVQMIVASSFIVVMEIPADHIMLDRSLFELTPRNTAVFQWAIQTSENEGCRALYLSGRGSPIYPGYWKSQFDSFIKGTPAKPPVPAQMELGL